MPARWMVVAGAAIAGAIAGLLVGWSLWGAGVDASGLSIVLMLAGLPLYWWTRRSLNTQPH